MKRRRSFPRSYSLGLSFLQSLCLPRAAVSTLSSLQSAVIGEGHWAGLSLGFPLSSVLAVHQVGSQGASAGRN